MKVLLVDGQGGRIGRLLAEAISARYPSAELTAVGTNSAATAAMLKGGAEYAATGENALVVCAATADIIIGPLGIVLADSMLGEITAAMAVAVARSRAMKILLPVGKCSNLVAGIKDMPISDMISDAVEKLGVAIGSEGC